MIRRKKHEMKTFE
jgi:ribosomal protein L32E